MPLPKLARDTEVTPGAKASDAFLKLWNLLLEIGIREIIAGFVFAVVRIGVGKTYASLNYDPVKGEVISDTPIDAPEFRVDDKKVVGEQQSFSWSFSPASGGSDPPGTDAAARAAAASAASGVQALEAVLKAHGLIAP